MNVAARDLDGDGLAEIITGPGPSPFSDPGYASSGVMAHSFQMVSWPSLSPQNLVLKYPSEMWESDEEKLRE